jgi:formylglycine-generating enzyme required for sulfatase activity
MKKRHSHSRREFLELLGLAASVTALQACTPRGGPVEVTATPESLGPAAEIVVDPDGFEMVLVEAGSFEMGSASGYPSAQPVHTVEITRPFFIAKYQVTFAQYDEYCLDAGKNLPDDRGWGRENRPATLFSWYDGAEYCNWLSERAGFTPCYSGIRGAIEECDFTANGYRYPTEAEWEYAARGGPLGQGYAFAGGNYAEEVGWYIGNSNDRTQPVGLKMPNELGLYDMSGNVWENCWDWYDRGYYAVSPTSDPLGPDKPVGVMDQLRVRRGGSFQSMSQELRVDYRSQDTPYMENYNAIRLVRTA